MQETIHDDLHQELALLEAEEAKLSAQRRYLHQQIDFGFATATTREREREVSDQRRQLHQRINAIRETLDTKPPERAASVPLVPLADSPSSDQSLLP